MLFFIHRRFEIKTIVQVYGCMRVLCMFERVYLCMCAYLYMCKYLWECVFMYTYLCLFGCVYVCICVQNIYVCAYLCVCIYVYRCVYLCISLKMTVKVRLLSLYYIFLLKKRKETKTNHWQHQLWTRSQCIGCIRELKNVSLSVTYKTFTVKICENEYKVSRKHVKLTRIRVISKNTKSQKEMFCLYIRKEQNKIHGYTPHSKKPKGKETT